VVVRGVRREIAVALALAVTAAPGVAQRTDLRAPPAPGFASVVGVVDDSLRGGALVGATVAVIGTPRRATTDRDGFFRVDSVSPGEVQLAVLHPVLDTLFLVITSPKFTVGAGAIQEMAFSTPPLARVRDRICPRGGVATGRGILVGRVDGADDDQPVANALVSLVYTDPASGTPIQRVRSARTRADGLYAICGIPETISGTVQAQVGAQATSEISLSTREQLLVTASFLVGGVAAGADSTAPPGKAVLTGRVTDVAGTPVAQAQVAVEGGNQIAVTDAQGAFTLRGLRSGTTSAVVRKIGFSPALRTVHLKATEPQRLAVVLAMGARTLATVTVTEKMDPGLKKVGFNERRAMGSRSQFLMPDDIAKRNARFFTDLFRMMPGFRVTDSGVGQMIEGTRSAMGGGSSGCVNVFVDRVAFEQMTPGDLDLAFAVNTIAAVEGYASAAETPQEFQMPGRACATIVAWTRMKLAKP
jgi:hypothetical protein